jgi:hypothetical protein
LLLRRVPDLVGVWWKPETANWPAVKMVECYKVVMEWLDMHSFWDWKIKKVSEMETL